MEARRAPNDSFLSPRPKKIVDTFFKKVYLFKTNDLNEIDKQIENFVNVDQLKLEIIYNTMVLK